MTTVAPSSVRPRGPAADVLRLATIGAGRIGSNHAEIAARRIPGAALTAVSDPVPDAAQRLATALDVPTATTDAEELLRRDDIDAVLITAPARCHTDLVVA